MTCKIHVVSHQAICSRHGLAVGAKTIIITKFFMLLTSPLSWPISKLLDLMLGKELGTVYNRARLIELLRVTQAETDLNKDEVNILTGALVLQEKKIEDIMTPLGDCYMLALQAVLDFDTISEIKDKGYSRIPVYDDDESNVVHILLAKDLLFIDPDDKKPLAEVCGFYKTPFIMAEKDRPLNKMLDEFKTGEKGHLAIVKGDEDQGAIGLVTLEDIIEEIIQAEIIDETDIVMDNKTKRKRKKKGRFVKEKEVRMFMEPNSTQIDVSSQVKRRNSQSYPQCYDFLPGPPGGLAVFDNFVATLCPRDHQWGDPEKASEVGCVSFNEEPPKLS